MNKRSLFSALFSSLMKRPLNKAVSFRDLLATAWPIILITSIGFYIAYQFVQPAPPKSVVITTGDENGSYFAYAKRYAEILKANGITMEIKTSSGSRENLDRLQKGDADIAFFQGGAREPEADKANLSDKEELRSLGSISYEPVWVFYRGEQRLDKLFLLKNKRIAIGAQGSGRRGLAMRLLKANGISSDSNPLSSLDEENTVGALEEGLVDAAFIVAAPEAATVQEMLQAPDVKIMSFTQADAYLRRFPFLSKITLPRGVVDLVRDIPSHDTTLLTTTANVVVRDDLHPALASLMLQAMAEVHGKSGFFQRAGEFPAYKDESFALSAEGERYYKSGPPFLQRYLPFWVAVLVERLLVLIVPLIVLLFPLLRIAPAVYTWRVRSKIFRCYGDLKFMENELRQHYDPTQQKDYFARLNRIEDDAYAKNVPLAFTDLLYTLRTHINLVREKLIKLEAGSDLGEKP